MFSLLHWESFHRLFLWELSEIVVDNSMNHLQITHLTQWSFFLSSFWNNQYNIWLWFFSLSLYHHFTYLALTRSFTAHESLHADLIRSLNSTFLSYFVKFVAEQWVNSVYLFSYFDWDVFIIHFYSAFSLYTVCFVQTSLMWVRFVYLLIYNSEWWFIDLQTHSIEWLLS